MPIRNRNYSYYYLIAVDYILKQQTNNQSVNKKTGKENVANHFKADQEKAFDLKIKYESSTGKHNLAKSRLPYTLILLYFLKYLLINRNYTQNHFGS